MHSPVKVNDQLGDAYKQVVNSYGVRRQVGRTLCVCEGSTYMTCVKGAQGPRIKVYSSMLTIVRHGLSIASSCWLVDDPDIVSCWDQLSNRESKSCV